MAINGRFLKMRKSLCEQLEVFSIAISIKIILFEFIGQISANPKLVKSICKLINSVKVFLLRFVPSFAISYS